MVSPQIRGFWSARTPTDGLPMEQPPSWLRRKSSRKAELESRPPRFGASYAIRSPCGGRDSREGAGAKRTDRVETLCVVQGWPSLNDGRLQDPAWVTGLCAPHGKASAARRGAGACAPPGGILDDAFDPMSWGPSGNRRSVRQSPCVRMQVAVPDGPSARTRVLPCCTGVPLTPGHAPRAAGPFETPARARDRRRSSARPR